MVESEKILSEFLTVNGNGSLKTASILVVDEDALVCLNIQTQLKEHYQIISKHSGAEALAEISHAHPNLILCSSLITVSEHVSLLHALKQNPETENIPVILLSGRESLGEIEVYDTEADDYLIKPFSSKELFARVRMQFKIISLRETAALAGEIQSVTEPSDVAKPALLKAEELSKRYDTLLMQSPFGFSVMKGKEMMVTLANDLIKDFWGKGDDVEGKTLLELLPELADQPFPAILDHVYTTGIPSHHNEILARLNPHGVMEDHYFNVVYLPYYEPNGTISGVVTMAYEVTEMVLARKKVEESEQRFRNLVEKLTSPVCILKGEDMVLEVANEPVYKVWGVDNKALGKPFLEIIPEMKDQPFMGWLLDVYHNGVTHYGNEEPAYFVREDGSHETIYFNFVYQPYREDNGTITGVMVLATDVTLQVNSRKKIEESEAFNRTLLESNPDCLKVLDSDGRVIFMNSNGLCALEIDDFNTVKNELWWGMWSTENQQTVKAAVNKALAGENAYFQAPNTTTKGTPKWWDVIVSPVLGEGNDKKVSHIISVSRDITKQKREAIRIKESEARFRSLVAQAPVAICILKGNNFMVEIANDFYLNVVDKGEDFIGRPLFDSLPELQAQGIVELLDGVMKNGTPFYGNELELHLIRNEKNAQCFFNFVYQPLLENDGTIGGIIVVANEVTEQVLARKKIEESEAHLRKMADLMPAKITNADPSGGVTYCNSEWLNFTGLTEAAFIGFGYHSIMHPDELAEFEKRFDMAAQTDTDLEMEMRFLGLDGGYKWHLNRASPVRDENGEIKMWVGFTTEIQKMKEDELKKENFLKTISHELKTPVTSIKGYVQLLLSMLKDGQEGKLALMPLKSSLVRVNVQVSRLTRLINEILDIARLNEDKLQLDKELIDLNYLVTETVQDILLTTVNHQIKIINNFSCSVYCDKDRIGQVVINLITNAIKYSPVNNGIEVEINQAEKNRVTVSIRDFGIGIEKKDQEKLFDRFYRVEGKMENVFSGFGIGLFIAKEIIIRHNGSISVESEKGEGSVFTFTLPCI